MRLIIFTISLITVIISCQPNKKSQTVSFRVLLPDSSKTHEPKNKLEYLKAVAKKMNLARLDTGVTGTEIRLWITSMMTQNQLVALKIKDNAVSAQKFDYSVSEDGLVNFKKSERGYDRDSLHLLRDEINEIVFEKMISQSDIKGFTDNVADGIIYDLEISTSKYYKLLTYHCPEHFADKEKNNKRFLNIILILDRHLHFYMPFCTL